MLCIDNNCVNDWRLETKELMIALFWDYIYTYAKQTLTDTVTDICTHTRFFLILIKEDAMICWVTRAILVEIIHVILREVLPDILREVLPDILVEILVELVTSHHPPLLLNLVTRLILKHSWMMFYLTVLLFRIWYTFIMTIIFGVNTGQNY